MGKLKVQDEQALIDATMRMVKEYMSGPEGSGGGGSWSFDGFMKRYMGDYGGNMPVQHGLFRVFLSLLGEMLKGTRGNTTYHDLGVSALDVTDVINGLPPFEKVFFNTEIFVLRRGDGTVRQYGMFQGEGRFGKGQQQVTEADLVDLSGGDSMALDGAMSDVSGNGVQNRVVKGYVDGEVDGIENGRTVAGKALYAERLGSGENSFSKGELDRVLESIDRLLNGDNGDGLIDTLEEVLGFINKHKEEIDTLVTAYVKRADVKAVAFSGQASDLVTDSTHRLVTDAEKQVWGDKYTKGEADAAMEGHDESGGSHPDIRNSVGNVISGAVPVEKSEYARMLGTQEDHYTKTALDAKINKHIKAVDYDASGAIFTFVFEDGTTKQVDTPVENTVKDGYLDPVTDELVLVLVSGQEIRIAVNRLVKVYSGAETATACTGVSTDGKISVDIKQGAVDGVHLAQALRDAISSHQTKTGDTGNNVVTFADRADRVNIASGESHSILLGKVKRWFADLKAVAFTGRAADLETDAAHRLVTEAEKTAWGEKAAAVHPHTVADVNGLQNELNGKYSTNYSYTGDADAILGSLAGKFYGAQNAPYEYYPFLSFGYNLYRGQFNTVNNSLKFRSSNGVDGALGPWVEIWHSGNFNPANHSHTADQVNDSKTQTVISGNIIRKILVAAVKSDCGYMSRACIGLANPKNAFSPLLLSVGQNDDGTRFTDFYFHPDGSITSPLGRFAVTTQLPAVFVQSTAPASGMKDGDIWVKP